MLIIYVSGVMDKAQRHTHTDCGRVHLHQRPAVPGHSPQVTLGPMDVAHQMGSEERRRNLRVPSEHATGEEHIRYAERRR